MIRRKLLVATHNAGKVAEYSAMLAALEVEWVGLEDAGISFDVEETGDTFLANAILKAKAYASLSGLLTLAEDSGLEVDALDGAPGIYTARYGGPELSHTQRFMYLLDNMVGVADMHRTARFRCVIALVGPDGEFYGTSSGVCEGVISFEPLGDGGFGYDPVFYLPELGMTMAQLAAEEKHAISHRGRALKVIEPFLYKVLT